MPDVDTSAMRLWTIHPRYLDAKGLVAAWREALLAQKVLGGKTRGYRNHPQLNRFQSQSQPLSAVASFLAALADEATERGYEFDRGKINRRRFKGSIPETRGQLLYEWSHLKRKLRKRAPLVFREWRDVRWPKPHPLFRIVPGKVRDWEKLNQGAGSASRRAVLQFDPNNGRRPPVARTKRTEPA